MDSWIIPCNPFYYDVIGAFDHLCRLDWKQSNKIEIGDTVYIYVGKPVKAILYKCKVNKVNLDSPEIDDSAFVIDGDVYVNYGNYMELELIHRFSPEQLPLERLKSCGLRGNVQGPRTVPEEVQSLLFAEESQIRD